MEDVAKRLSEATATCLKKYEEWKGNQKDGDIREALMEAVHELRKVGARLEIEMAISERDQMASKPIPIPPHRSSKKRPQNEDDDSAGNKADGGGGQNKKSQGGGGGGRRKTANKGD